MRFGSEVISTGGLCSAILVKKLSPGRFRACQRRLVMSVGRHPAALSQRTIARHVEIARGADRGNEIARRTVRIIIGDGRPPDLNLDHADALLVKKVFPHAGDACIAVHSLNVKLDTPGCHEYAFRLRIAPAACDLPPAGYNPFDCGVFLRAAEMKRR